MYERRIWGNGMQSYCSKAANKLASASQITFAWRYITAETSLNGCSPVTPELIIDTLEGLDCIQGYRAQELLLFKSTKNTYTDYRWVAKKLKGRVQQYSLW